MGTRIIKWLCGLSRGGWQSVLLLSGPNSINCVRNGFRALHQQLDSNHQRSPVAGTLISAAFVFGVVALILSTPAFYSYPGPRFARAQRPRRPRPSLKILPIPGCLEDLQLSGMASIFVAVVITRQLHLHRNPAKLLKMLVR
jgi:hypothetical protein